MARYDKYNPIGGGFRAKLAADWADADVGVPRAVALDSTGKIVKSLGTTGIIGVLVDDGVPTGGTMKGHKAGTVMDVMMAGEIVEVAGLAAGTAYYAGSDGVIDTTNTDARVGFTVEATRLIVRVKGGV